MSERKTGASDGDHSPGSVKPANPCSPRARPALEPRRDGHEEVSRDWLTLVIADSFAYKGKLMEGVLSAFNSPCRRADQGQGKRSSAKIIRPRVKLVAERHFEAFARLERRNPANLHRWNLARGPSVRYGSGLRSTAASLT